MSVERFGQTPEGADVHCITLRGGGLVARLLTWGAVVQDLRLEAHAAPLVLGFAEFAPYLTHSPYFGATAGRCANRIRDGHVEIDGRSHTLDRNFLGRHHLHGGAASAGKRLWRLADHGRDFAVLEIDFADGEMGYPGALHLQARFALQAGGVFEVIYEARAEAPTLCNPAHHSYFVLDDTGSILDHRLKVAAEAFLPVDDELIPTGEVRPVAGTAFDFRTPRALREAVAGGPLDHNFCLSAARTALRPVAWLESPHSGVQMELRTTEPGLQVYAGHKIDIPLPGLDGRPMGAFAGIALEPQVWPDANHHPHFPQALLRPSKTYRQHTQFAFSSAA